MEPGGGPRSSLSIFPSAVEDVVGQFRRRHSPSGARGFPAHITILHPFVPLAELDDVTLDRLAAVCAGVPSFTATLTRSAWFPDGLLYLAAEPEEPFRALTAAVWAAFSQYPPYEGLFPDGIPHVTIGQGPRPELLTVESAVQQCLPIEFTVSEVHLTAGREDDENAFDVVAVLPLGRAGGVPSGGPGGGPGGTDGD